MKAIEPTKGTRVFANDNIYLGDVQDIVSIAPHGHLPASRYLLADYGPVSGSGDMLASGVRYMHVRDSGFTGFCGRNLRIPVSEVHRIDHDGAVLADHSAVYELDELDSGLTLRMLAA